MTSDILICSLIVAAAFPLGALVAKLIPWSHSRIAAVMATGAGLLLAAAFLDLIPAARHTLSWTTTIAIMLAAALFYSALNAWLAARGARHRKRCGNCQDQLQDSTNSKQNGEGGTAIALGTVMDAVPEALVLGVTIAGGASPWALVIALALGNLAQSLSASDGLFASGRSPRFVWGLWGLMFLGFPLLAFASAGLASVTPDAVFPALEAVAAGVLIALVAEAMLPEAAHEGTGFTGIFATLGAALFIALTASLSG